MRRDEVLQWPSKQRRAGSKNLLLRLLQCHWHLTAFSWSYRRPKPVLSHYKQFNPRDTEVGAKLAWESVWDWVWGTLAGTRCIFSVAQVSYLTLFSSVVLHDFDAGPQKHCTDCVFLRQLDCFSIVFLGISSAPSCLILIRKLPVKHVHDKVNTYAVFTKRTYSKLFFLLHCLILY